MFIMENPNETIPRLFEEINEFGALARLYINKNKTKILCKKLQINKQKDLQKITGCEIMNKVKYLGIVLTMKTLDLFKNNYEKMWDDIQKELERWRNLKLSFLGRIASIKMNILPKVMFLFQTIPIIKKVTVLDKWQK